MQHEEVCRKTAVIKKIDCTDLSGAVRAQRAAIWHTANLRQPRDSFTTSSLPRAKDCRVHISMQSPRAFHHAPVNPLYINVLLSTAKNQNIHRLYSPSCHEVSWQLSTDIHSWQRLCHATPLYAGHTFDNPRLRALRLRSSCQREHRCTCFFTPIFRYNIVLRAFTVGTPVRT